MQDNKNMNAPVAEEFEVNISQVAKESGAIHQEFIDEPENEVLYGEEAKGKAPVSKAEKKLAADKKKMAKAKARAKKKKKKSRAGVIILKMLCVALFIFLVAVMALGRMDSAFKLVGSTELPELVVSIDENTGEETIDNITEDTNKYLAGEYKYIVPLELEEKGATALAAWYLTELGGLDGTPVNQLALEEFNAWYNKKVEHDETFKANYEMAIAYFQEHPEALTSGNEVSNEELEANATENAE